MAPHDLTGPYDVAMGAIGNDRGPDALSRTRVAVSAGFFLQGLVFAAIVTQVPRFQDAFDFGEGAVTGILVMVAVLSGLGSVVAGAVAARGTSATAFAGALSVIAVAAALIGLAPSFALLVAAFVVYGIGLGAVDAGMNMQGVRVQAALGHSVMGGFHGWWSVGGITGALYASACTSLGVPLALDLAAVTVLTLLVVWRAVPHLVRVREVDPGLSAAGRHLPWRPVLVFGGVILVFYAADTGTLTWSSVYLDDALDASKGVVPLGYAAYQIGALASRFGGDVLVRRRDAAWVAATATGVGVLGLAIVVAAPVPAMAIAGFAVTGLGLAILAPLSFAALAAAVPAQSLDVAIARMNIANYLGAILGGGIIGAAASAGHLRWAFVIPLVAVPLVWTAAGAFGRREPPDTGRPAVLGG